MLGLIFQLDWLDFQNYFKDLCKNYVYEVGHGKFPVLRQFSSASLSAGVIDYGATGLSFRQPVEHGLASSCPHLDSAVCRGYQDFLCSQAGMSQSAGQAGALTTGTIG